MYAKQNILKLELLEEKKILNLLWKHLENVYNLSSR